MNEVLACDSLVAGVQNLVSLLGNDEGNLLVLILLKYLLILAILQYCLLL